MRRGLAWAGRATALAGLVLLSAPSSSVAVSAAPSRVIAPSVAAPATATVTAARLAAPGATWCGWADAAPPRYDHVVWIFMENKDAVKVADPLTAPFLAAVAQGCGAAAAYTDHGVHPSLPNYIAATSGGTQGVTDDAAPAAHPLQVDNIFRQVRATGQAARSYQESMPVNCSLVSSGRYAVKHNPAAYYVGGDDRAACLQDDLPLDRLWTDLDGGQLPAFAFITPDLCSDTHDCPVATGDEWLRATVLRLVHSATYAQGRTAIFLAWDESEGAAVQPFYVIAPSVRPGARPSVQLDHAALLAFTERSLGIGVFLGAAAHAADLGTAFGI